MAASASPTRASRWRWPRPPAGRRSFAREFYQGIPVQMKVKEFVESEEFRQAKQALADLEEQFRRTGLPPGWTR